MITLFFAVDSANGERRFLGSFEAPSMKEADRRAGIVMRGSIYEGAFKESEMLCVTFSGKTQEEIEREMPHFFQGGK